MRMREWILITMAALWTRCAPPSSSVDATGEFPRDSVEADISDAQDTQDFETVSTKDPVISGDEDSSVEDIGYWEEHIHETDLSAPREDIVIEIVPDGPNGPGGPCETSDDCEVGLFCDEVLGTCVVCRDSRDCEVGQFCFDHACLPWVCVPGSSICDGSYLKTCGPDGEGFVTERNCDDSNPCTVGDGCEDRRCVPGKPLDCGDGNPCTADVCTTDGGCMHAPLDGVSCDDGDPCSTHDRCVEGTCLGEARDCSDGNPCTDDFCEPARGCVHLPNQAWCEDGDPCTGMDSCTLGICLGTPVMVCDDLDPCTKDRCAMGTCVYEPVPECGPCVEDPECDDGNPCSQDLCSSGSCIHIFAPGAGCCEKDTDCFDSNDCTLDQCLNIPFGTCRRRAIADVDCCVTGILAADFQSGDPQGFVPEALNQGVGWHLTQHGFSTSPPWSLYYGNPETFDYATNDSANSGSVWSPEIILPAGVQITLRFWVWMDVETPENLDILTVSVIADVGEFVAWKKTANMAMKTWREVLVDLSVLQAHPVRLRFTFDTRDGVQNNGQGIFLDDIRITSTCRAVNCANDLDCLSLGFNGSCQDGKCNFNEITHVELVVGKQGSGAGDLRFPFDVSTGPDNTLMVSDRNNNRIQVFAMDGSFLFTFGKPGKGEGQFQSPHGLARSGERVYVADTKNHRIQVFTVKGVFMFSFGTQGSEPGFFYEPKDVATSLDGGAVYVADTSNHRVQVFDRDGGFILAFGEYGKKAGQFRSPSCVFVDSSHRVFVCDTQNHRIQILTWDGNPLSSYQAKGEMGLDNPYGAVLLPDGFLAVADTLNHRLVYFSPDGTPWGVFGMVDMGTKIFDYPMGLAVDTLGRLLVADSSNHRIVVVSKTAFP